MKAKTRLIILLGLVCLFLIVAPYLIFYSLGYRFDFDNVRIVTTGGIYVRAQPTGATISIDGDTNETTGVFSNAVFIQNLLPKEYVVLVTKDNYYDYQKNLLVEAKEVTKLENVILFSKNIPFELSADTTQFTLLKQKPLERFIIKNGNLYYSDSPENTQPTQVQKATPIIKGIIAFKISNNSITWLGTDGFLKKSDINGQNTEKASQVALKVDLKASYQIEMFSGYTFLKAGDNLLLLDRETKSFIVFYSTAKDFKTSPDNQKIAYFNDNQILISQLADNLDEKAVLANSSDLPAEAGKITDCYWLNNDYIIYNTVNNIVISEIDHRGNINSIILPPTVPLTNNSTITIEKPQIFFDQQNRRLYIFTQNQLVSSDKILP